MVVLKGVYLRSNGLSFSVKKVMAFPLCPALPVRPLLQRQNNRKSKEKTVQKTLKTILLKTLFLPPSVGAFPDIKMLIKTTAE